MCITRRTIRMFAALGGVAVVYLAFFLTTSAAVAVHHDGGDIGYAPFDETERAPVDVGRLLRDIDTPLSLYRSRGAGDP